MLELKRLNGAIYFLNPNLVLSVEATPDTVITLVDGDKLMVANPVDEVVQQFTDYHRTLHRPNRSTDDLLQ